MVSEENVDTILEHGEMFTRSRCLYCRHYRRNFWGGSVVAQPLGGSSVGKSGGGGFWRGGGAQGEGGAGDGLGGGVAR